jgi:hypothetical protein
MFFMMVAASGKSGASDNRLIPWCRQTIAARRQHGEPPICRGSSSLHLTGIKLVEVPGITSIDPSRCVTSTVPRYLTLVSGRHWIAAERLPANCSASGPY